MRGRTDVKNIVCAEGKQLMFKSYDAAPACINSESVEKLEQRGGWQTEIPNLPCTPEYMPVCGVDGISYGNMCALNANHMTMKYKGECTESSSSSPNTTVLHIDSKLVDYVGVGLQQCMLVREDVNAEWEMFYNSIEGFEYQEGTQYKISVAITEIENPPANSSSLQYTLVEVLPLENTEAPDICVLTPDPGMCKAYMPKYYFDEVTNTCEEFIWGGCGGVFPFESLSECQMQCGN